MIQMITPTGKLTNSITIAMKTAAIVAPTTGIRSKKATTRASGPANGAPRMVRTMNEVTPATVACSSAPAT